MKRRPGAHWAIVKRISELGKQYGPLKAAELKIDMLYCEFLKILRMAELSGHQKRQITYRLAEVVVAQDFQHLPLFVSVCHQVLKYRDVPSSPSNKQSVVELIKQILRPSDFFSERALNRIRLRHIMSAREQRA